MYVVQITNTPQNSKYKIGHVTNIDKNTKLSSEDVVSPAFMLASQLGTVTAFTDENDGKNASEHCDKYIEVRKDGKNIQTGDYQQHRKLALSQIINIKRIKM